MLILTELEPFKMLSIQMLMGRLELQCLGSWGWGLLKVTPAELPVMYAIPWFSFAIAVVFWVLLLLLLVEGVCCC